MNLLKKIKEKEIVVGVIGLGYVGLPLVLTLLENKIKVVGYDKDKTKINKLLLGESYIKHIKNSKIRNLIYENPLANVTFQKEKLAFCDVILICVPTPLKKPLNIPDTSYIENAVKDIIYSLKKEIPSQNNEKLIILESSTYPSTTRNLIASKKFLLKKNIYCAYSPERENPADKKYNITNTPKIVGAISEIGQQLANKFYDLICEKVVPVDTPEIAEMSKLLENTFRLVNISLINEIKIICDELNIDIWKVIDAASTKPFGFMPFYPSAGVGGHCISVDPHYLNYIAKQKNLDCKFICHANKINEKMIKRVIRKIYEILNLDIEISIKKANILLLGTAYKKDIDDYRNSPAIPILNYFLEKNINISYYDPYIKEMKFEYSKGGMISINSAPAECLNIDNISQYDLIVIITDHSSFDYNWIVNNANIVIDTRNATKGIKKEWKIRKV